MDFDFKSDSWCRDLPEEVARERKYISKLLLCFTLVSFVSYIAVQLIGIGVFYFAPTLYEVDIVVLLINNSYTFFVILLFSLVMMKSPSAVPQATARMTFSLFIIYMCMSIFFMFVGSLAGNGVSVAVSKLINKEMTNSVEELVNSFGKWELVVSVVILAPVAEEFLFRKILIDKISRYGSAFSIIISGVTFGAFHGNFYQFFYAVAVGMLLAYVYCVYGKVRYCIFIHMAVNLIGSIFPLFLVSLLESEQFIHNLTATVMSLAYILSIIAGGVFFFSSYKKIRFHLLDGVLIRPFLTLKHNVGTVVYAVYITAMFIFNIIIV